MKKLKRIIRIIIFLIVLILILIFIRNKINNRKKDVDGIGLPDNYTYQFPTYKIKSANTFFTVEYYIQRYLDYLSVDLNLDETKNTYDLYTDEDKYGKIYNILSESYIEKNSIDLNNIGNFIELQNNKLNFTALDITGFDVNNIRVYAVYGRVEEQNSGNFVKYCYYKVLFDVNNNTFSIEPIEDCQNIDNIDLTTEIEYIENKENNIYSYVLMTEGDLLDKYITYLKNTIEKYPEEIYDKLDSTYKEAKFSSIDEFKIYINNNKSRINKLYLKEYVKKYYSDYTQFICIDKSGRYYIFNQNAIMDFSIILDTYTVDIPIVVKKYEDASNQEKTVINIKKIVDAINDQDYNYVYGKLADSFKNNYFKTIDSFKEYAQNSFGIGNEVEFESFIETSNYCIYTITLKNGSNELTKTVIMKLQDGTDFVMSFDVD